MYSCMYVPQEDGGLGINLTTVMTNSGHAYKHELLNTVLPVHGHTALCLFVKLI